MESKLEPNANKSPSMSWVPGLLVILFAAVWGWFQLDKGWFPHDEGQLGQAATRILDGEVPHRDFDDMYTGGLSYLNALSFKLWGVNSISMRRMLFIFWIPFLGSIWWLLTRSVSWRTAAPATLLCAAWSIPTYFAPLPSWYNLFFSTWALCAMLAFGKSRNRGWLLAAGLLIGTSICFKSTGIFALAAALLMVLFDTQPKQRTFEKSFVFVRAAIGIALLFALAIAFAFIRKDPLMQMIHFAIPFAAIVLFSLWQEFSEPDELTNAKPGTGVRWQVVALNTAFLVTGVTIPIVALVAWFWTVGATGDLYRGIFVLPQMRLEFARLPFPPLSTLGLTLPLAYLLYDLRRGKTFTFARTIVIPVACVAVALVALGSWRPFIFLESLSIRHLGPVMVAVNLWALCRLPMDASNRSLLFGATTFAFFTSLIQFPYAVPVYFFYAASLIVVGIVAGGSVLFKGRESIVQIGALSFLAIFSMVHFDSAFPNIGLSKNFEKPEIAKLETANSQLRISISEATPHNRLQVVVDEYTDVDDRIYALPDAPQAGFLTNRKVYGGAMYEFFREDWQDNPDDVVQKLLDNDVQLVVVNELPSFSAKLTDEFRASIENQFSLVETIEQEDRLKFTIYVRKKATAE